MSYKLKDLRSMSVEELIEEHDNLAGSTQVGINYYLDEIARRDLEKHTEKMLKYTFVISIMTLIITIFTIFNAIIVFRLTTN